MRQPQRPFVINRHASDPPVANLSRRKRQPNASRDPIGVRVKRLALAQARLLDDPDPDRPRRQLVVIKKSDLNKSVRLVRRTTQRNRRRQYLRLRPSRRFDETPRAHRTIRPDPCESPPVRRPAPSLAIKDNPRFLRTKRRRANRNKKKANDIFQLNTPPPVKFRHFYAIIATRHNHPFRLLSLISRLLSPVLIGAPSPGCRLPCCRTLVIPASVPPLISPERECASCEAGAMRGAARPRLAQNHSIPSQHIAFSALIIRMQAAPSASRLDQKRNAPSSPTSPAARPPSAPRPP